MVSILLAWAMVQHREPPMTELESTTAEALKAIGGKTSWVEEDHWQLSLDIQNTHKKLDLGMVTGLKRLYALRVFQGGIDEESLRSLATLKNLGLLVILSSGMTDKGMVHIGKLLQLDKLDVKSDSISSKGLACLRPLKKLTRLYLYNTKIKDSDLAPLMSLKQLTVLDLPPTVTDRGLAKLRTALPKAHVTVVR